MLRMAFQFCSVLNGRPSLFGVRWTMKRQIIHRTTHTFFLVLPLLLSPVCVCVYVGAKQMPTEDCGNKKTKSKNDEKWRKKISFFVGRVALAKSEYKY